ncbi:MAG: LPS export ABC transporter permease LptG [Ignavibacteria bacterium]|nr:MAG: LPS export ABC transporter permease LptG [Ignavibacteria bacterium]
MRRLDRYVIRQFLKSFLFAILAFSLIFIIVDMIENLDDFIDQNVGPHLIGLYYVYFLPRIFSLMVPVAMLLSALFVVGRLSNNNEMTIIKCAGVSLYRFMLPLLGIGLVVSLLMLGFDGWLVPRINAARINLEREHLKKHRAIGTRYNLFFQETDSRILTMEYFDEETGSGRRVKLQRFDKADPTVMLERLDAERMVWNEQNNNWMMYDGLRRRFISDSTVAVQQREQVGTFDSLAMDAMVVTPEVIIRMQQKPEEMELGDFRDYIERQRLAGSDIARLLVDYHGKIAFPFASLIVVFFGVPFASVKRRSGLAVQFGISILLLFIYLVSQKLSQIFGYNGNIHPLIAAWMPNLLFLLAGSIIMSRVQK